MINYLKNNIAQNIIPKSMPQSYTLSLNFSAQAIQEINIASLVADSDMKYIQCVYIDNSANTVSVSLSIDASKQVITAGALTQGYYSLILPINSGNVVINGTSATSAVIIFLSIPMPPQVWESATPASAPANQQKEGSTDLVIASHMPTQTFISYMAPTDTSVIIVPQNTNYSYYINHLHIEFSVGAIAEVGTTKASGMYYIGIYDATDVSGSITSVYTLVQNYLSIVDTGLTAVYVADLNMEYYAQDVGNVLFMALYNAAGSAANLNTGYISCLASGGYTALTGIAN
ncbi:MAG TPA: DUF1859 domain-containing protein [Ignavibacteria bacterium]|nr:DUF1859 domain-containing protein [Ignavibacteria bacterium]